MLNAMIPRDGREMGVEKLMWHEFKASNIASGLQGIIGWQVDVA